MNESPGFSSSGTVAGNAKRSTSMPEDRAPSASTLTASAMLRSDDDAQPHSNQAGRTSSKNSSSSNSNSKAKKSKAVASIPADLPGQLEYYKEQIALEKAGKRKLFHSLVKLANELRKMKDRATPMEEQREYYYNRPWYQGGMWRAPAVLPALEILETAAAESGHPIQQHQMPQEPDPNFQLQQMQQQPFDAQPDKSFGLLLASPISLSDLFFSLVVVTAFTRVGVGVSQKGALELFHLLYFAVFWTVWSKEASYSTRFDTTDLSASVTTLVTSLAVLFACLSSQAPIPTNDGTRIMIMAGSVAILHCLLHVRVAMTTFDRPALDPVSAASAVPATDALTHHVRAYAIYNIAMNACEAVTWGVGIFILPVNWEYRWTIFLLGIVFALRIPRAFLSNDFHGASPCLPKRPLFLPLFGI
jgi:Bacterial low temperature requirement A protein (LtrA)